MWRLTTEDFLDQKSKLVTPDAIEVETQLSSYKILKEINPSENEGRHREETFADSQGGDVILHHWKGESFGASTFRIFFFAPSRL